MLEEIYYRIFEIIMLGLLFTLFGLYVGGKIARHKIVEATIDDLILKRFIKTKMVDGETEILQYDQN